MVPVALLLVCCAGTAQPLSRTVVDLLGTVCTITLYSGGGEDALDTAFARIRQIDERQSVQKTDSELARVNLAAGTNPVKVSADTFAVIREGLEFSRLGNGVFDITVGPLVKLWGIGSETPRVPLPADIGRALARVDFRSVVLSAETSSVFLKKPGMALDLGAIGKGYAADEAARILKERGVSAALIDLGGNILAVGKKPDGTPWRIGIQDPEQPRGSHLGVLRTAQVSVVTSGSYQRFFESGGVRYHHILDTRTGYPTRSGLLAVAVVAARSVMADGYSTLLFALGLEKGRQLVEAARGEVNAIFVTEDRKVYVTEGIRDSFTLTGSRYVRGGW